MIRNRAKRKKAYIGGKKDPLEIKKSNHYYKGLYQELLLPHPVCWKSQEHLALYSCQISDQIRSAHPNAKPKKKKKEKGNKENPNPTKP